MNYAGRVGTSLSLLGLRTGQFVKGVTEKLQVNSSKPPRFFKPRPVPYALRESQFSEWTAPVVPQNESDDLLSSLSGIFYVNAYMDDVLEIIPRLTPYNLRESPGTFGAVWDMVEYGKACCLAWSVISQTGESSGHCGCPSS